MPRVKIVIDVNEVCKVLVPLAVYTTCVGLDAQPSNSDDGIPVVNLEGQGVKRSSIFSLKALIDNEPFDGNSLCGLFEILRVLRSDLLTGKVVDLLDITREEMDNYFSITSVRRRRRQVKEWRMALWAAMWNTNVPPSPQKRALMLSPM